MTTTTAQRATWRHREWWIALVVTTAVLAAAVAAAISQLSADYQVGLVESIALASANSLAQLGTGLPFGYAFAAGMVAAVNPCGFALLPAYLGVYLGTERPAREWPRRLLRALAVGLVVSSAFVVFLGATGLLVAVTTSGVVRFFPWIGLVVGVVFVATGAATLAGVSPHLGMMDRVSDRAGATAQHGGLIGYAAYGVAYAAGSLGCTLPIFLSVVATGMTTRGPLGALFQFVLFGLGMGTVLSALALTAALLGHGATRRVRSLGAYLQPLGPVVLLLGRRLRCLLLVEQRGNRFQHRLSRG